MRADKIRALAALAVVIGIIAFGIVVAIASPPRGAATATSTPVAPSLPARSLEPTATDLPYAIEGRWDLDFQASGLIQPTLASDGPGIGSGLVLDRGMAQYWSGYGGGCDDRRGTFETDGIALVIRLGKNNLAFGCNEAAIDEVVARLALVVSVSLEPCPPGYRLPAGLPAPTDGSCRQLWLYDGSPRPVLVYAATS